MDITIRQAEYCDIEKIIQTCRPEGRALEELVSYRKKYFTESGKREYFLEGFPETLRVAEYNGLIAGYLHFFTDCWDGYEDKLPSLGVNPNLSYYVRVETRRKLEEEGYYE